MNTKTLTEAEKDILTTWAGMAREDGDNAGADALEHAIARLSELEALVIAPAQVLFYNNADGSMRTLHIPTLPYCYLTMDAAEAAYQASQHASTVPKDV